MLHRRSVSRLIPLVDILAAWKLLPNISRWILQTVERGYRIRFDSFQRDRSYWGGCRASSGVGTGSKYSAEEEGHRGGSSSRERIRVLQPVLRCSDEGWGVASEFRSASAEPLSHATEVQDAHYQTGHVSDQVRRLACQDRTKRRIFLCLHPSSAQKIPEVFFWGRSSPISGSSVRPCTLTPNFHEVCGCFFDSTATPGHLYAKLYWRLVDSSSIRADGGSTSRCRSRPYGRVGVKSKHQENCAFSITEDHLSGSRAGYRVLYLGTDRIASIPPNIERRLVVRHQISIPKPAARNLGYIPKMPSSVPRPIILQALCSSPFREPDQQKLNCMCPMQAQVRPAVHLLWSFQEGSTCL